MHRWMLQGLAFTCLAVAGLAAANKPASAMVSAAGPSLLGTKGARHGCDQPDRTAMELPTKYRDRRADVSFAGRMTAGPTVTVGGQVRQPGPVKLGTAANLWSAIQRAGGATEFGAINRVRLTREQLVKEYDMRNPEHRAIPLSDRDTIEVPQKSVIGR